MVPPFLSRQGGPLMKCCFDETSVQCSSLKDSYSLANLFYLGALPVYALLPVFLFHTPTQTMLYYLSSGYYIP